ncbi:MAG: hypothetical protein KC964_30575, partial [Candidatus Omnitrophica bacterium]|nr:hypothetical protein [Candidatus Omnitrophota bacterium]
MSENQPEPEEIEAAEVNSKPSFLDFTSRKNLYLFALGTGVFLGLVFLLPVFSRLVWIAAAPIFLCVRFRQNKDNFISGLLIGIPWFLISCYWLTYVTVFGLI